MLRADVQRGREIFDGTAVDVLASDACMSWLKSLVFCAPWVDMVDMTHIHAGCPQSNFRID